METKKWYQSKTLIANVLAAGALLLQSEFGYLFSPEAQAFMLMGINFALRLITTKAVGK